MKYLNTALIINSDFIEGLISKAYVLCRLNRCDEGQEILTKKILVKDVNSFSFLALRGIAAFYWFTGNHTERDKISELERKAAKTGFEKSDVYSTLGGYAHEDGDLKGCVEKYKLAAEADNESSCNHYHLGDCYFELKEYDKSITSFLDSLAQKESIYTRLSLSQVYATKAIDYRKAEDMKNSSIMFDKALENLQDWRSNLEMLKFYIGINEIDEAYRSAFKAAELFDDEPKVLAGYIIQGFRKKDEVYSKFMKKIIGNMTDRYNANELGYYMAYDMQNNKTELQSWIKQSLADIQKIKVENDDIDRRIEINLLSARFYLLSLNQTGSLLELEKANELFAAATKIRSHGPKLHFTKFYIEQANRILGKGRFLWDTRVMVEKKFGINLPMWMVYMIYDEH